MSQRTAYRDTECCDCGDTINAGEPVYFSDDGKLCEDCAEEHGIRCPVCGGQKRSEYETCFGCS